MGNLQELEILVLEIVGKHSTLNNTYSLTRFFAKSSILPNELYKALKKLVDTEYLGINEIKNTIKYYELTTQGKDVLNTTDIYEYLTPFAMKIDQTGFICKIIFLLENKDNVAEVIDSFLLSDGSLIAFLNSPKGKLTESTVLENYYKKKWIIKEYVHAYGSIESCEKIKVEEKENTFQYLIVGVEHYDKPDKGETLKIVKNIS